jgi:hypothetical protein
MSFRQPPKQADSHTFLSSFWVLHTKGLPKVSAKEIELHKNILLLIRTTTEMISYDSVQCAIPDDIT